MKSSVGKGFQCFWKPEHKYANNSQGNFTFICSSSSMVVVVLLMVVVLSSSSSSSSSNSTTTIIAITKYGLYFRLTAVKYCKL